MEISSVGSAFNGIVATLVIGLIIGFIADRLMGAGGLGLLWCVVLGLVGSVVGGFLFSLVGTDPYGLIGRLLAGIAGMCIVLFAARSAKSGGETGGTAFGDCALATPGTLPPMYSA